MNLPHLNFNQPVVLGRTGLLVGRLGISSGYKAPTAAIEEAFERGCNYFTWGTIIKGYVPEMGQALRNIAAKGRRDRLVLAMFTYAHNNYFTELLFRRGLKSAGLDYADVLILGYFSRRPSRRLIDGALRMKEKGLVRFIGVSSHNRKLFPRLAADGDFDVFHLRYNAAHRGAESEVCPFLPPDGLGIVSATRMMPVQPQPGLLLGEEQEQAVELLHGPRGARHRVVHGLLERIGERDGLEPVNAHLERLLALTGISASRETPSVSTRDRRFSTDPSTAPVAKHSEERIIFDGDRCPGASETTRNGCESPKIPGLTRSNTWGSPSRSPRGWQVVRMI